jgi:hypothetical protein
LRIVFIMSEKRICADLGSLRRRQVGLDRMAAELRCCGAELAKVFSEFGGESATVETAGLRRGASEAANAVLLVAQEMSTLASCLGYALGAYAGCEKAARDCVREA